MGGRRSLVLVPDDDLRRWYCDELLTMEEIGVRVGCTRAAVSARLKKMDVSYRGGMVDRKCKNCGESYKVARKRVKQKKTQYCSMRCYQSNVSIFGKYSRQGQRKGREVADAKPKEIVHHVNGDTMDNRPENLIIFKSNAAHISFHKSGAAKWYLDMVNKKRIVPEGVLRWPVCDD